MALSCKSCQSNSSAEIFNFYQFFFHHIKTPGIFTVIWFGPWLSDRAGLTIMCQYSKSLLFNRRALFPGILQSPLIHWPFPWKHSSLVTLTDEQRDPLTSNLFMLMVLTLLIVSQAPHSCLISSVDLYFPEILSISSPSDSITFSSIQHELSPFFSSLIAFQNL